MNAPDKIWYSPIIARANPIKLSVDGGLLGHVEYIRADLHQSALATIARLQAELIAKDDAWIADQTNNAAEIIRLGDKLERLQARLDAGPSDSFGQLIADAKGAAEKAMRKFPQPNYVMTKFAEEAGEVTRGCIHMAEKRPDADAQPSAVRGEMVQAIAMLYRLWVEGDQVHGLPPVGLAYEAVKVGADDK